MISHEDADLTRQFAAATVVFEGTVVDATSFHGPSGNILTRYAIQASHPYKGQVPWGHRYRDCHDQKPRLKF